MDRQDCTDCTAAPSGICDRHFFVKPKAIKAMIKQTRRRNAEFAALCERHAVAPAIALENNELREALKQRHSAEVERILREEF